VGFPVLFEHVETVVDNTRYSPLSKTTESALFAGFKKYHLINK
jgi:hypothetical protein